MKQRQTQAQRIHELEELLEQAECKSDILTNLLKEASAEFNQTLDKVSQSEANFRAIIETAPEAIYIFDVHTRRILDCNPFTIDWLGYSRQELLGMGVEDIIGPTSDGVDENIRKALEHGYVRIQERQYRTKTGRSGGRRGDRHGGRTSGTKVFRRPGAGYHRTQKDRGAPAL